MDKVKWKLSVLTFIERYTGFLAILREDAVILAIDVIGWFILYDAMLTDEPIITEQMRNVADGSHHDNSTDSPRSQNDQHIAQSPWWIVSAA